MSPRGVRSQQNTLRTLVNERGFSSKSLARAIGVGHPQIDRMCSGDFAPNAPFVAKAAEALGVSVETIAKHAKKPPMAQAQIIRLMNRGFVNPYKNGPRSLKHGKPRPSRSTFDGGASDHEGEVLGVVEVQGARDLPDDYPRHLRHRKQQQPRQQPGQALARIVGPVAVERAISNGNGSSNGHTPVRGTYNKLRQADRPVRQAVRNVLMNMNMAAMHGHTEIPVPMEMLRTVMQDYLGRLGIKATMLVDPAWVDYIDHT